MIEIPINRESDKRRLLEALRATEMPYRVKISKQGKRSIAQNSYLWGVCYETILQHGLKDQGWTNQDLHDYFLGEHFGWETIEGFGRKRIKPIKRSSVLDKMEFVDYVAFIQQKAAEMGIVIPDPEQSCQE